MLASDPSCIGPLHRGLCITGSLSLLVINVFYVSWSGNYIFLPSVFFTVLLKILKVILPIYLLV